jgi:hypothetical protein
MLSSPSDHPSERFLTRDAVFLKNGIRFRIDLSILTLKGWANVGIG